MTPEQSFRVKAPGIMNLLIADFGISVLDASAIMGNLGHESLGLTAFQEIKPTVKGSAGGWGWAQWTGPRRRKFDAYVKRNNLDPKSDKANYGFMFVELRGTYAGAIPVLKKANGLAGKVKAFELQYEGAGIKNYPERERWAEVAWDAYKEQHGGSSPVPDTLPPIEHHQEQIAPPPDKPMNPVEAFFKNFFRRSPVGTAPHERTTLMASFWDYLWNAVTSKIVWASGAAITLIFTWVDTKGWGFVLPPDLRIQILKWGSMGALALIVFLRTFFNSPKVVSKPPVIVTKPN